MQVSRSLGDRRVRPRQRKGKMGALGIISGLKQQGTVSLPHDKEALQAGPGEAQRGEHTSLMRQLCEFRSRWMMHMECR